MLRAILGFAALAALAVALAFATKPARAGDDPVCRVQWDADGTCAVMPPPGTGLDANGRGWVHCPQVGPYTFHGGVVAGKTAPQTVVCGRDPAANRGAFSPIQQTSSRLEWTRPDGKREQIPRELLYPPM